MDTPPARTTEERYAIAQMDEVAPVECSCGEAARAFADLPDAPASFHIVRIHRDSRTHYHKKTTEIYYVLEGEGTIELDGAVHPLRPGTAVLIRPGCRHRAVGDLKIVNVPVPAHDPEDEYFD